MLGLGLALMAGCATLPATPPEETLPETQSVVDEVAAILRFVDYVGTLPNPERKVLIEQWERRLTNGSEPNNDRLHLALLLTLPGSDSLGDAARARKLLAAYLVDHNGNPQALLDFARYQLAWMDERERWIKAARRERRLRRGLERKLEALKAIERRMTEQNGRTALPIP